MCLSISTSLRLDLSRMQGWGQTHICAGEELPTSWYSSTDKDSLVNTPADQSTIVSQAKKHYDALQL